MLGTSVLLYLRDDLLEVYLGSSSSLQGKELFWKNRIEIQLKTTFPKGSEPEYSSYEVQSKKMRSLKDYPGHIKSFYEYHKADLRPYLVDLGPETKSWLSSYCDEHIDTFLNVVEDSESRLSLYVFVLAWGSPRVLEFLVYGLEDSYDPLGSIRGSIYISEGSRLYWGYKNELERTHNLPTLEGLEYLCQDPPISLDTVNTLSRLGWTIKEGLRVKYIIERSENRLEAIQSFVLYALEPEYIDFLISMVPENKLRTFLPKILDQLASMSSSGYRNPLEYSKTHLTIFKHLLVTHGEFLGPQSLGKTTKYHREVYSALQCLEKTSLIDYHTQIGLQSRTKVISNRFNLYIRFEYQGDIRAYFEKEWISSYNESLSLKALKSNLEFLVVLSWKLPEDLLEKLFNILTREETYLTTKDKSRYLGEIICSSKISERMTKVASELRKALGLFL